VAGLGQLTGQLVRNDVMRWYAAAVQALDPVLVGLRETEDVSVQL
jgi:hypothetical protein